MKFLISIFTLLLAMSAQAHLTDAEKLVIKNNIPGAQAAKLHTRVSRTLNSIKLIYDFSKVGGAVGDIKLKTSDGDTFKLPAKAIIRRVLIDTVTAPTSGGSATIALKAVSAGDLKAAAAFGTYTGLLDGIPAFSAATSIKTSAEIEPVITIGTAALTAGKIVVFMEYVLSE